MKEITLFLVLYNYILWYTIIFNLTKFKCYLGTCGSDYYVCISGSPYVYVLYILNMQLYY